MRHGDPVAVTGREDVAEAVGEAGDLTVGRLGLAPQHEHQPVVEGLEELDLLFLGQVPIRLPAREPRRRATLPGQRWRPWPDYATASLAMEEGTAAAGR